MPRPKNVKKAEASSQRAPRKTNAPEILASVESPRTEALKTGIFAVGDRISHPQFGDGRVTAIEDHKLSVTFDTQGSKQIIDSYVKRLKK